MKHTVHLLLPSSQTALGRLRLSIIPVRHVPFEGEVRRTALHAVARTGTSELPLVLSVPRCQPSSIEALVDEVDAPHQA